MKAFEQFTGLIAPMDRANVDTDQIIPKQFLKSIKRTGFGDNLFDAWRYLDEGLMNKSPNERRINHDFVLNQSQYQGASILLTRTNFGCGSSREHAVWALLEYGFKCVIAPAFADIFYNNCFKNGLLPIVLNEDIVGSMFAEMTASPGSYTLEVDLQKQRLTKPDGTELRFDIAPERKASLLSGLDEIGKTLVRQADIKTFEEKHQKAQPWLFTKHS
jgi:3-isopropylmalate/(R)-2-methylmalate dehydratase small subunit